LYLKFGRFDWYRIAISPVTTRHNKDARFCKSKRGFFTSLFKNILAYKRIQKYTIKLNLGFIKSDFYIMADWRRSQMKMNQ
jgi:hypothetical protein